MISKPRILTLALVLLGGPIAPSGAAVETAEEVQQCVLGNLPRTSSVQTFLFRIVDRDGGAAETRARLYWERDDQGHPQVLLRILDPSSRRGSAALTLSREGGSDMWVYLPATRRPRRIDQNSMNGAMFGTDFSYEDFQRLMGLAMDSTVERKADERLSEREAFVLEARPGKATASAYDRIVSKIDKEHCLPAVTEMYGPGGKLTKVLTGQDLTKLPNGWLPKQVRMEDRSDGSYTDLIIEEIEADARIPDGIFSVAKLDDLNL